MQVKKELVSLVFLIVMAVASLVLCFIGVYAAVMSPNTQGTINPSIICKVEKIDTNDVNSSATSENNVIFDNSSSVNVSGQFMKNGSLKYETTISDTASTSSTLYFKLTNYTTDKHIQLRFKTATVNSTHVESNITADYANCDNGNGTSADVLTCVISLPNAGNGGQQVTLGFEVIEVFKIVLKGEGITGSGNNFVPNTNTGTNSDTNTNNDVAGIYYCPNNENAVLSILAKTGYTLDRATTDIQGLSDDSFNKVSVFKGTYTISADKVKDAYVSISTKKLFTIYENTADENKLPTNGKTGTDKKVYRYFVEMGMYPQTIAPSSITKEVLKVIDKEIAQTLISESGVAGKNVTLYKHTTLDEYYVGSPVYTSADYSYAYSNNTSIPTTQSEAYFKVEPIKWIVIGAGGVSLDSLHFYDNALYTNSACTTPFTGNLELMCASALDTTQFNLSGGNTFANFNSSQLKTFLNAEKSNFNYLTHLVSDFGSTATTSNNFIKQTSLNTYSATSATTSAIQTDQTDKGANFFVLAGMDAGQDNDTDVNNFKNQSYHYSSYFTGAGFEDATYTIGVASPTDYALAHYAISGQEIKIINKEEKRINASCTRGWEIKGGTSDYVVTNATTCYWTRSVGGTGTNDTSMAGMINCNGYARSNSVIGYAITVRPCVVLDMNFYYNPVINE